MSNFGFLSENKEYELFSKAAIEAERVYNSSPAMCAVGCRKALELAVKWVYSVDTNMELPYKDNLQSLIHEPSFRFEMDPVTWGHLPLLIKIGNLAVHTSKRIEASDALVSLRSLFDFVEWIDYCYGSEYEEREFDENQIPKEKIVIDEKKIKQQESLIEQKETEIQKLREQLEQMSARLTASKGQHKKERTYEPEDLSEFMTRKKYIDVDLRMLGWNFTGPDQDVREEYEVNDMDNHVGQQGFVDYVLLGKDGLPLAVVEAKRTSKDPKIGRKQASLYADALERKFGRRPMIFYTNGFETFFWDDKSGPERKVSGLFSKGDLEKLMNRREEITDLMSIPIDDKITDRYYQKEAIRAVCEHIQSKFRKNLLVMATGTGKTRTASSLTDVLSRGHYVTNVLFLADRTALVKQAKEDFKNYLPDMSLCNLCSNKDDASARIVFSTYPTMMNAIDSAKTKDGIPLFTPAHFDLIIIDESHRSIFKKYRTIFEYFDAILVGLTATPKEGVDANTYTFFEMEHGVPTYAYDYETAVHQDHVLVPYYNYEIDLKIPNEGITYDDLSDEDKARYEDDFAEDDYIPEYIPSSDMNKFVFNEDTVDHVLQDLMERGIKIKGGDQIGKTIIFAQNKKHAEYILERFNKLYPQYNGKFAQRVICDDSYAQSIIDDFKNPEKEPFIVVSVDMMDTGIDVPECVNLVFFKSVRSKIKFWQMIGRGTRLCKGLECIDSLDGEYTDKKRFLIFDYCGNFEFFRVHKDGYKGDPIKSLSESIYTKQVKLIVALQDAAFIDRKYQDFRADLVQKCHGRVSVLIESAENKTSVKLIRRYVEKFSKKEVFVCLQESDKEELVDYIAPNIYLEEQDEFAKRFDNFMYGLMLAYIGNVSGMKKARTQLVLTGELLQKKATIPQVYHKLPVINEITTDEFWNAAGILEFERVRNELRDLIKFLDPDKYRPKIYTDITDEVLSEREGQGLDAAYDFEDYRKKVNRYVEEHGDTLAIHKLKHNIPLSMGDYTELERVFTSELGSAEDYHREYGDTPFGLLIRKIAKLDHEAAMQAFSEFINDESLNQRQISFVQKIINHIEQNGYMENINDLQKPPFDKPVSFIKMFDATKREAIIKTINRIKNNALANEA